MTALLIFDLDGTLIDSELLASRALAEELTAAGFAVSTDEVVARFVGVSNAVLVQTIEQEHGRLLPGDFNNRAKARMEALYTSELRAVDGIETALGALALPRCVASNSPSDYIARSLALTGLDIHFDAHMLFSADMVARPKPAPDVYLHAAASMKARPADCLVIEDSVAGVSAARAAGMTVLGFAGAGHVIDRTAHGDRLHQAGADRLFDDYAALADLVAATRR